jgi:hypothetical protein
MSAMPKGPRGERCPADVIGNAIKVGRIATGEVEDERHRAPGRVKGALELIQCPPASRGARAVVECLGKRAVVVLHCRNRRLSTNGRMVLG